MVKARQLYIDGNLLYPGQDFPRTDSVSNVTRRRIEQGFEFDPQTNVPFFNSAILCFRIVEQLVYRQNEETYKRYIPDGIRFKLDAFANQVYRGR